MTLTLPLVLIASEIPDHSFWIDQRLGKDSNNGTLDAPYATLGPLARFNSTEDASFLVQLSPGQYDLESFSFVATSTWKLKSCIECPSDGTRRGEQGVKILLLIPPGSPKSNFISKPSALSDSRFGLLSLTGIEFAPKPDLLAKQASFGVLIDLTAGARLVMEHCSFHDFFFDMAPSDPNKGIIASRNATFLLNSTFSSNLMYGDESTPPIGHLIADCWHCYVKDCHFFNNSLEGFSMWGGLFLTWNATFSNSIFEHSYASLSGLGAGLSIAAYPQSSNLSVYNCSFLDNEIESGETIGGALGAAIFAIPRSLFLNVSETSFLRNSASLGTGIAITSSYGLINGLRGPEWTPQMPVDNFAPTTIEVRKSTFIANQAPLFGLGASILIHGADTRSAQLQEGLIKSLTMTDVIFEDSFTPPAESLPDDLSHLVLPATAVDLARIQEVRLKDVSVSSNSLASPSPSVSPNWRIRVQLCRSLVIKTISFSGTPLEGQGSALLIQSVENSNITDIFFEPFYGEATRLEQVQTSNVSFSAASLLNAAPEAHGSGYSLVFFDKYPQAGTQPYTVSLTGMEAPSRITTSSIVGARFIDFFELSSVKGIGTSTEAPNVNAPMIALQSVRQSIKMRNIRCGLSTTSFASIIDAPAFISMEKVEITGFNPTTGPTVKIESSDHVILTLHDSLFSACSGPVIDFRARSSSVKLENTEFSSIVNQWSFGGGISIGQPSDGQAKDHTWRITNSTFTTSKSNFGTALASVVPLSLEIEDSKFSLNLARTSGGALYCKGPTTLAIRRSSFTNNKSVRDGGAIYATGTVIIEDSVFSRNQAEQSNGGAVYLAKWSNTNSFKESEVRVTSSEFNRNAAHVSGGAIFIPDPTGARQLLILSSQFSFNAVSSQESYGGAIGTALPANMKNSTFSFNESKHKGGAIAALAPSFNDFISISASDTKFDFNKACLGGAISYSHPSSQRPPTPQWNFDASNVEFYGNEAFQRVSQDSCAGGAIYGDIAPSLANASSVLFNHNVAERGGAIYTKVTDRVISMGYNITFDSNRAECCGAALFYEEIRQEVSIRPINATFIDNSASWGAIRATSALNISATILPNDPPFPDSALRNFGEAPLNIYAAYAGVPRTFVLRGRDQFGQDVLLNHELLKFTTSFRCTSDAALCAQIAFESTVTDLEHNSDNSASADLFDDTSPAGIISSVQFKFNLASGTSAILPKPIEGLIVIKFTDDSNSLIPSVLLMVSVQSCGLGYGEFASPDPIGGAVHYCALCPLNHYSFNGTCALCTHDAGVQTCSGARVIAPATWWVVQDRPTNRYQSLRCSESFCGVGNKCLLGRTGTMCGQCKPGLHESITPICVDCSKTNWGLLILILVILWIAVLVLHSMVAVSSGKSTILIFFVKCAWVIRQQIPYVSGSTNGSLFSGPLASRILNWMLCLWPMNYIHRHLVITAIPVVMMIQLSITFGIYHLVKAVLHRFRPSRGDSKESQLWIEPLLAGEDEPDQGKVLGDEVDDSLGFTSLSESDAKFELQSSINNDHDDSDAIDPSLSSDSEDVNSNLSLSSTKSQPVVYDENYQSWIVNRSQSAYFHHYRYIRTILSLYASTFSWVLGAILSTTGCITLITGEKLLAHSPDIPCDSSYIPRSLFYLGIPWIILVAGSILAKLLHGYFKGTLSSTDVRFGVWYEMYRPTFFAWKVTEFARHVLVDSVANQFTAERTVRASMLCVVMIASLAVQVTALPYKQLLENLLETFSLTMLSVIAVLVYWYSRIEPEASWPATTSLVLFILVCVILIITFASSAIKRRCDARRSKA